jgi:NitT/TauT family transport system substrate-binding protein
MRMLRFVLVLLIAGGLGCKKGGSADPNAPLRLGFFPNVTHAQALVGNAEGTFTSQPGVGKLEVKQFNAGPSAMEALVAGSLDVSYVGTGPAINTFLRAGRELRIIAGSMDGGAVFVTRTARTPEELHGKKLASPQLGNTQDIALRHWLKSKGLKLREQGGDVDVIPLANPDILGLFLNGGLEGAWVPEPWGARLINEGGAKVLVDERDLWPDRRFPTTVLVTTRRVLETRPEQIKALLRAHVELTRRWQGDPAGFSARVNEAFAKQVGKPLPDAVLKDAFSRVDPTVDVSMPALQQAAKHARELNFVPSDDLTGLVDTRLLDEVKGAPAK